MMSSVSYFLADVGGVLCVACRQADFNEPRYVICFWPTKFSTRVFCANYEVTPEELRTRFKVRQSMPGEFYVEPDKGYPRSCYMPLAQGAQTKSVKAEVEPVPKPRVGRETKIEWESGRWRIAPLRGKVRYVYV